jgi:hypothetical protein
VVRRALWAWTTAIEKTGGYLYSRALLALINGGRELNAGVAFAAAMAGGAVGGFIGAFFALPIAAVIQAFLSTYSRRYDVLESDLT